MGLLAAFAVSVSAQVPRFSSVTPFGGSRPSTAYGLAVDSSGNTYVAGSFGSVGFAGVIDFGSTNLTSVGGVDGFFAKYDPSGSCVWARQVGGPGLDEAIKVAVAPNGDVLVVGAFSQAAQVGSSNVVSSGGTDIFAMRFGPGGDLQWIQSAGGATNDSPYSVAADVVGGFLVTGAFAGQMNLGTNQLTANGDDAFLVRFRADGSIAWVRTAQGTGDETGADIAIDGQGFCYWVGDFTSNTTFGGTNLTPAAGSTSAAFLSKYNASGTLQWARALGQGTRAQLPRVAVTVSGAIYASAVYSGSYQVDSFTLPTGSTDGFLARLTSSGQAEWVRTLGGTDVDAIVDIALDNVGNAYLAGHFRGTAAVGTNNLTSAGNSDVLVAGYSSQGNVRWAVRGGSPGSDVALGVALDPQSRLVLAGSFSGSANFGGISVTSPDMLQKGFLAELEFAPILTITPLTTQVRLSWLTNFVGFTLEAASPDDPSSWSAVGNPVSVSGSENFVLHQSTTGSRLFRLRSN